MRWGSEFSSYEIELRYRLTEYDLTLVVDNSNFFTENNFGVTNSTSKNVKLKVELLTQTLNLYFATFKLLTQSRKRRSYTSSY